MQLQIVQDVKLQQSMPKVWWISNKCRQRLVSKVKFRPRWNGEFEFGGNATWLGLQYAIIHHYANHSPRAKQFINAERRMRQHNALFHWQQDHI